MPWYWWLILVIGVVVWLLQTWFGYNRRTHDPTWALKYQNIWEGGDACEKRSLAAVTIEAYGNQLSDVERYAVALSDIDDALDILEDIGFYVFGDQISPEAAYHHFYYWIQGYWSCAGGYMKAMQKDRDPTRWQNIEPLFLVTSSVEIEKRRPKPTRQSLFLDYLDRQKFLAEERALG